MTKNLPALAAITLFASILSCAQTPVKKHTLAPSPKRDELDIPPEIWKEALAAVGCSTGPLGFSQPQLSLFPANPYRFSRIVNLFRDVRAVPRFSGSVGDALLKTPENFADAAALAWNIADCSAGRGITELKADEWGLDWIPAGTGPDEALQKIFEEGRKKGIDAPASEADMAEWNKLSKEAKRLVVKLVAAAIEAGPVLREAFPFEIYARQFAATDMDAIPRDALYSFAAAPWRDESPQPVPRAAFDALAELDMNFLAFGTNLYLKRVQDAICEWRSCGKPEAGDFKKCVFKTVAGAVEVFGTGPDKITGAGAAVTVDLGGDDSYAGRVGVPTSFAAPIALAVDLGGNDSYDGSAGTAEKAGTAESAGATGTAGSCSIGCGMHGIGAVIDLGGDDKYDCGESGLGCGWYGAGVVVDFAGNDSYRAKGLWAQGAAHAGVGLLMDLAGDDEYLCISESQGFGSTLGVGVLLDVAGNDKYLADLKGRPSAPFHGRSVSLAQGVGFGRRADFGDGHTLAGGFGILVDGAGNDKYEGGVFCQGAGYWWAMGICEDRSGDDSYSNDWYSLGSAPHFAIGSCVDLAGNDHYNVGNSGLMCQTQGCARDGCVAVFIDGAGDDTYFHRNRCAGAGDMNSIALFWDRCGDDKYTCDRKPPYHEDRSYGGAVVYPAAKALRDEVPTIGVFLDTGGADVYEEQMPESESERGPKGECGEGKRWRHNAGPTSWSFGLDADVFSDPAEPPGK
ncbi:MAG: hypothetical protein RDV41_06590 [Planctomycetota bacterium]|nr:hypothetical protein [Planctomycetota bacterium]